MIVWDAGSYANLTERDGGEIAIADALAEGHALFWLEGRKLRGGYALTRIATGPSERWLLVKRRDKGADARRRPLRTQPESVLSGRTLEDLREGAG